MSLFKSSKFDLTSVKILATLAKFFNVDSFAISEAEMIFESYKKYKLETDNLVSAFSEDIMDINSLNSSLSNIKDYSLFYSFCFDYYKYIPIIIALQGYKVSVLVEDRIYNEQIHILNHIIGSISKRIGKAIDVEFITNKDTGIILKLRARISSNYKVIVFADGNKGSNNKVENLLQCQFKGNRVLFHQGFGLLCYLLKQDSICNVICRKDGHKLFLETKEDILESTIKDRHSYIREVTTVVVKNIDRIITLGNVHRWDALVSLYQWLPQDQTDSSILSDYIPFILDKEYYLLNKNNFLVKEIGKNAFKEAVKFYE